MDKLDVCGELCAFTNHFFLLRVFLRAAFPLERWQLDKQRDRTQVLWQDIRPTSNRGLCVFMLGLIVSLHIIYLVWFLFFFQKLLWGEKEKLLSF